MNVDATGFNEYVYYIGRYNLFYISFLPSIYYLYEISANPDIIYLGEL